MPITRQTLAGADGQRPLRLRFVSVFADCHRRVYHGLMTKNEEVVTVLPC